jgi:crotonobetaine/carnitine-CoA ligase
MREPPSSRDGRHALKNIIISGDTRAFCERFGVRGYAAFNMSEICTPTFTEHSLTEPRLAMSCGRMRSGIEARIVDEHDNELPPGTVGELIMRTDRPYMFSHGYLNDIEATASAWRNGWFHSGDLMRVDDEGNYFFIDRLKDMIRRRGENISSYEVEAATTKFPAVREAAAIPIRDGYGEEEVMIVVALDADHAFSNESLIDHLVGALPHFMVPRYIRVVDDFPRTPTGKVLKRSLAGEGITPSTWDRESHGIFLKRNILS